jgi:predicted helicase
MRHFRYYQEEASQAICRELQVQNQDKCLVKMFCGTGKSLLMRQCPIHQDKNLVVYVFPSLSLILQFTHDYLADVPPDHILNISSDTGSTTDPEQIAAFLRIEDARLFEELRWNSTNLNRNINMKQSISNIAMAFSYNNNKRLMKEWLYFLDGSMDKVNTIRLDNDRFDELERLIRENTNITVEIGNEILIIKENTED